jgi:hypothetical protein
MFRINTSEDATKPRAAAARSRRTTKITRRRKPERSGARNERNEAQAVGGRVQRLVRRLLVTFDDNFLPLIQPRL